MKPTQLRKILILGAAFCASISALAQTYPSKPVRLIVPFAAGGTTDIVARVVADPISKVLGQPIIVENKAGGGGVVGAQELARATPDGYILGMATVSTTATNPAINPNTPYHPITDFTPIINIAATPAVLTVNKGFCSDLPPGAACDYKNFLAHIKKNPGKYSYASSGTGGVGHLQTELFKSLTGIFMTHIPYRGAGPAINDTAGGQVPILFDNLPSSLPFIKSGHLIAIAVAAPARFAFLPDTPTFKELGLEPVNRSTYFGIYGPKNLPKDVVLKMNAAVKKTLEDPAVRKRIEETGSIVVGNTPEQFAAQIRAEYDIYKKVVESAKLKLQ